MRILDLFSGIGGFSLGLHRASKEFRTVAFCEQDPFCTQILNKHWPDVPVYPDIRKLNGKEIGAIDIICGGFPCQPFSQAGKQRGKDDDRDLWPEMFRIIQELQPHARWIVAENVAGFVNMELSRTVSDLEGEGYEVRTFVLGACAVQAPHQRQRCWIVAHAGRFQSGSQKKPKRASSDFARCSGRTYTRSKEDKGNVSEQDVADSDSRLRETKDRQLQTGRDTVAQGSQHVADSISQRGCGREAGGEDAENVRQPSGGERARARDTQRGMGDLADGLSAELLDIGRTWEVEPDIPRVAVGEKNRVKKLKALGNSVVPQIPEILGRLIIEIETAEVS